MNRRITSLPLMHWRAQAARKSSRSFSEIRTLSRISFSLVGSIYTILSASRVEAYTCDFFVSLLTMALLYSHVLPLSMFFENILMFAFTCIATKSDIAKDWVVYKNIKKEQKV